MAQIKQHFYETSDTGHTRRNTMTNIKENIEAISKDLAALAEAMDSHTMSPMLAKLMTTTIIARYNLLDSEFVREQQSTQKEIKILKQEDKIQKKSRTQRRRYDITVTEQVVEVFKANPDKDFTEKELMKEIAKRHPKSPIRPLSQILSIMKNSGLLGRISTYPSRFKLVQSPLEEIDIRPPGNDEKQQTI